MTDLESALPGTAPAGGRDEQENGMQVRYPPRSGWLDELDRLKGGWSWV